MLGQKIATTTYNHCDSAEKQIPLPIASCDLSKKKLDVPRLIEKYISIPTAQGQQIILLLRTDSPHLAKFFSMNWPAAVFPTKPDSTIVALKEGATLYRFKKNEPSFLTRCSEFSFVKLYEIASAQPHLMF